MHSKRITLENLPNTRDLGGLPAADGKTVRPRRLLRSGALAAATPADIRRLVNEYELRTIVDFRTDLERGEEPDPEIPGVKNVVNPILETKTLGITWEKDEGTRSARGELGELGENNDDASSAKALRLLKKMRSGNFDASDYMASFYRNAVTQDFSIAHYRAFFDVLLRQERGSVLWHCSMGKDRAGLGTALVLLALGVPRSVVEEDYLATNEFVADVNRADAARYAAKAPFFMRRSLKKKLLQLFEVKPAYLHCAFDAMEERCGSIDAYLEAEMGLTPEKRERLRELYLD